MSSDLIAEAQERRMRKDLRSTLEHLVLIGNERRHAQLSLVEWWRRQHKEQEHDGEPEGGEEEGKDGIIRNSKNDIDDTDSEEGKPKVKRNEVALGRQHLQTTPTAQSGKRPRNSSAIDSTETPRRIKRIRPSPSQLLNLDEIVVHPKDIRQYGQGGGRELDVASPKRRKAIKSPSQNGVDITAGAPEVMSNFEAGNMDALDRQWNEECSDGIDIVQFYRNRLALHLSSSSPSASDVDEDDDDDSHNKFNYHPGRVEGYMTTASEAPRALLLRCWERAVHAASTSTVLKLDTKQAPSSATPPSDSDDSSKATSVFDCSVTAGEEPGNQSEADDEIDEWGQVVKKSHKDSIIEILKGTTSGIRNTVAKDTRDKAEELCDLLKIDPFENNGNEKNSSEQNDNNGYGNDGKWNDTDGNDADSYKWKCTVCDSRFSLKEEFRDHFLGSCPARKSRGCCWTCIGNKHRSLIQSILVEQVKNQVKGLMKLVVKEYSTTNHVDQNKTGNGVGINHDSDDKYTKLLINWRDILATLTRVILESRSNKPQDGTTDAEVDGASTASCAQLSFNFAEFDGVVETLLLTDDEFTETNHNLVLNKKLLQSVTRRLVQRYAMIPR